MPVERLLLNDYTYMHKKRAKALLYIKIWIRYTAATFRKRPIFVLLIPLLQYADTKVAQTNYTEKKLRGTKGGQKSNY